MRIYLITSIFMLCLSACTNDPIPPIGSNLPHGIHEAQDDFDKRVKSLFPVGSDEEHLRAELVKQGFQITADAAAKAPGAQNQASLSAHEFPCLDEWQILWSASAGKITDITGRFFVTCP